MLGAVFLHHQLHKIVIRQSCAVLISEPLDDHRELSLCLGSDHLECGNIATANDLGKLFVCYQLIHLLFIKDRERVSSLLDSDLQLLHRFKQLIAVSVVVVIRCKHKSSFVGQSREVLNVDRSHPSHRSRKQNRLIYRRGRFSPALFKRRNSRLVEHEHSEDPEELVNAVIFLSAAVGSAAAGSLAVDPCVTLHEKPGIEDLIGRAVLRFHLRKVVIRIKRDLDN